MRITIRQHNFTITPAFDAYIRQKIVRPVEKLLSSGRESAIPICDIEIERTTRHHRKGMVYRAEANITIGKKMLRAEAIDENPRAACDILEEELKREILKHKEKSRALTKRSACKTKRTTRYAPAARTPEGARVREE